jgi:antitoxin component of MazEF toxin-antitoxin module
MKNVVAVRKWGNSRGVIIPRFIQRQLNWRVGDVLYVTAEHDKLVFRPITLPKGVERNGDSEANDPGARRPESGAGAGLAGSESRADSDRSSGHGCGHSTVFPAGDAHPYT